MTRITTAAENIARRGVNTYPILRDLEVHLIAEQQDAIDGPGDTPAGYREPRPDDEQTVDIGHADPVPSQAARMGRYTAMERKILQALDGIQKAFDHAERTAAACMSTRIDPTLFDEPTCPGWTVELRARLGGCGKVPETYVRNDGTTGSRSLCASCRKAEGIERRAQEREQAA